MIFTVDINPFYIHWIQFTQNRHPLKRYENVKDKNAKVIQG